MVDGTQAPGSQELEADAIHSSEDQPVGWESNGCAALRYGKWKIVNMPATNRDLGKGTWELFDLEKDEGETNDLAAALPDKLKEMLGYWGEAKGLQGSTPCRLSAADLHQNDM